MFLIAGKLPFNLFIISLAFSLTGCVGNGVKKEASKDSHLHYLSGNYEFAANAIESDLGLLDSKTQKRLPVSAERANVLTHMDVAENLRMSEDYGRSIEHYDAVETLFKKEDESGLVEDTGESVGSILVNDTTRSYVPTPAERMLANYYKALSFWSENDINNARVEFNRANERARLAVQRYEDEIKKAREDSKSGKSGDVSRGVQNQGVQNALNKNYPNIDEWVVFDSFINPAIIYSNALFYGAQKGSQIDKSRELLTRVVSMTGKNKVVMSDLNEISKYKSLGKKHATAWVIYETGTSPYFDEKRFDLPWLIAGNRPVLISIALPELKTQNAPFAGNQLTINGKGLRMNELAKMETVMKTEFQKLYPATLFRAIMSAVAKGLIQNEAAKQGGFANLAATLYAALSTKADLRMWNKMPHHWTVSKVRLENNGTLKVPYGKNSIGVDLEADKSYFVYIKQPSTLAKPLVKVLPMS